MNAKNFVASSMSTERRTILGTLTVGPDVSLPTGTPLAVMDRWTIRVLAEGDPDDPDVCWYEAEADDFSEFANARSRGPRMVRQDEQLPNGQPPDHRKWMLAACVSLAEEAVRRSIRLSYRAFRLRREGGEALEALELNTIHENQELAQVSEAFEDFSVRTFGVALPASWSDGVMRDFVWSFVPEPEDVDA